jgi:hypothetical protein
MVKMRRRFIAALLFCFSLTLLLIFIIVPRQGFNAPLASQPARWCQCVDYVVNRFSLDLRVGPPFVGAADMGPFLENQGFTRVFEPLPGSIVVFPRSFGSGIDTTYGHVGVVTHAQAMQGGQAWALTVRGARQTWPEWTEHGCSNVSDMDHITVAQDGSPASFYISAPTPGRLAVAAPLTLSSTAPRVEEFIQATFSVRNVGQQPILIDTLTAGGRKGADWEAVIHADFPYHEHITLQPGESYHYEAIQAIFEEGDYFAEPAAQVGGAWGTIEGGNRVRYHVSNPAPPLTPTPVPATATPPPASEPTATPPPANGDVILGSKGTTSEVAAQANPAAIPTVEPLPALQTQWSEEEYIAPGSYTFRAWAGQGTRVYLDEVLVVDGLQGTPDGISGQYAGTRDVTGGAHTIRIEVYANHDGSTAHYEWDWHN